MARTCGLLVGFVAALGWTMEDASPALAQIGYQRPPKAVTDVLDAPPPPAVIVTPTRDHLLLVQGVRYPSVAELAAPMLRLAGLRINPQTNGPHMPPRIVGITIKSIADGKQTPVNLPAGSHFGTPDVSPNGRSFALTNTTEHGIELWIGDVATASIRRIDSVRLNAVYGHPVDWMPDGTTLLCHTVPADRRDPPRGAAGAARPGGAGEPRSRGTGAHVPGFATKPARRGACSIITPRPGLLSSTQKLARPSRSARPESLPAWKRRRTARCCSSSACTDLTPTSTRFHRSRRTLKSGTRRAAWFIRWRSCRCRTGSRSKACPRALAT